MTTIRRRIGLLLLLVVFAASLATGCLPGDNIGVTVTVRNESDREYTLLLLDPSGAPASFHPAVTITAHQFGSAIQGNGPWQGTAVFADDSCAVVKRFEVGDDTIFVIAPSGDITTTDRLTNADIASEEHVYADAVQCLNSR